MLIVLGFRFLISYKQLETFLDSQFWLSLAQF